MLPSQYRHYDPIGVEVRFNHEECGDKRSRLYVTRLANGWKYHCHNCAPQCSGFYRLSGIPSPKETLDAVLKVTEKTNHFVGKVELPSDFTTRIPGTGLTWLYKYGITDEEIACYNFGYSRHLNRLVLPVYQDDVLIFWQGRNLGQVTKQNPKYLNIRSKGRDAYFRVGCGGISLPNKLAIVEDILSAVKVGRICPSIALLGSYIPDSLTRILVKYQKVGIWLDPDKKKEAIRYAARYQKLLGKLVIPILTDKDPKDYTDAEIKGYIS